MHLPATQQQLVLAERPTGHIEPSRTFRKQQAPVPRPTAPGQVLIRSLYLSLDPAMRGWIRDVKSYIRPVRIDEVMRGQVIGEVVESTSARFAPGDHVFAMVGWQEYAVLPEATVEAIHIPDASFPLQNSLTLLGGTGMTAYFGLFDVGKPKPGDTVVVSGAAGATGSLVGQLAKAHGCRVIGIAGGPTKCAALVSDLGFDAAIDYKSPTFAKDLAALTVRQGKLIDVFFDNVGGDVLDVVLTRINRGARVVLCGAISQYNQEDPRGPSTYQILIAQRARMEGFIVFDYQDRYAEARAQLIKWYSEGKITVPVDILQGLDAAPSGLLSLFSGGNTGKVLVRIPPAPSHL